MQFDRGAFSLGVIAGVGMVLSIIFAAQLNIFDRDTICAGDENAITCVRNWFNAAAIVAGAATVFLLFRDHMFQREIAVLQTLDTRAQLVATQRNIRRLQEYANDLRDFAATWPIADDLVVDNTQTLEFERAARRAIRKLLRIEAVIGFKSLKTVVNYDIAAADLRSDCARSIANILNGFFDGDTPSAVRNSPEANFWKHVDSDWSLYVTADSINGCADEVDELVNILQRMTSQFLEFDGTKYLTHNNISSLEI